MVGYKNGGQTNFGWLIWLEGPRPLQGGPFIKQDGKHITLYINCNRSAGFLSSGTFCYSGLQQEF